MPELVLHVLPPSHPSHTAEAALRLKGLEFERVEMDIRGHGDAMEAIYGPGNRTVPGLTIDGEPVHGSVAILRRLEELAPEPPLYPEPIAAAVREAEAWGDGHLQDLGRRIPWGALRFRPEALGTMAGGGPLDPRGVDFALRFVHAAWKYHGITAERLAGDLQDLPGLLDRVDELVAEGVVGGEAPNAADLQIGATLRVLCCVEDVRPLVEGRPGHRLTQALGGPLPGRIPAGAFPGGWVPAA